MTAKTVFPSADAQRDIAEAARYYTLEAGRQTGRDFAAAVEAAYAKIAEAPTLGSPRYAHELNISELRHVRLRRFPYLVFYVEHDDRIEVWRVMHAKRDIPVWLTNNDEMN